MQSWNELKNWAVKYLLLIFSGRQIQNGSFLVKKKNCTKQTGHQELILSEWNKQQPTPSSFINPAHRRDGPIENHDVSCLTPHGKRVTFFRSPCSGDRSCICIALNSFQRYANVVYFSSRVPAACIWTEPAQVPVGVSTMPVSWFWFDCDSFLCEFCTFNFEDLKISMGTGPTLDFFFLFIKKKWKQEWVI